MRKTTVSKKQPINVMHHHHIDDPQADSHQPQLFSGLDFELLYASSRSQEVWFSLLLLEEGPANPSWALKRAQTGTGNEIHSFFFLSCQSTFSGPGPRKSQALVIQSLANPEVPLFVKLTLMLFTAFLSLSEYESSHAEYLWVLIENHYKYTKG